MSVSSSFAARSDRELIWLYSLPGAALAVPTIPAFVLIPAYYADDLGLGLATTGIVLLAVRLLDVITDPLIGFLADRANSKVNIGKLLMVAGAGMSGMGLLALFAPPSQPHWSYLFVSASALFVGWSAIQIPYLSWSVSLAPDYIGRIRLNAGRETAGLIGILSAGGAIAALSGDWDQDDLLQVVAWSTVLVGGASLSATLTLLPKPPLRPVVGFGSTRPWRSVFRNKPFIRLLCAWFFNSFANGLPAVCFPLYVTRILGGSDEEMGILIFVYFAAAVLGIPLWSYLSRSFGKHRVWCIAMIIGCLVFASVPLIEEGQLQAFALVCIITGLALGADLALPPALQADVADWDSFRFKRNCTGLLFSLWNMATKLALGAAAAVAFLALDSAKNSQLISQQTLLVVIYAGLPIVLKLAAISMIWRFPVDCRVHRIIRRRLDERRERETIGLV